MQLLLRSHYFRDFTTFRRRVMTLAPWAIGSWRPKGIYFHMKFLPSCPQTEFDTRKLNTY